jgi:molecular chaperone GrpE
MSNDNPDGTTDTATSNDEIEERWRIRLEERRQELEAAEGEERAEKLETVQKLEQHLVEEGVLPEEERRDYSLQGDSSEEDTSDSVESDSEGISDSPNEEEEPTADTVDVDPASPDVETTTGTIRGIYTGLLPTVLTDRNYLTESLGTDSPDIEIPDDDSTGVQESDGDGDKEVSDGVSPDEDSNGSQVSESETTGDDPDQTSDGVSPDESADDAGVVPDSVSSDDESMESRESESDDSVDGAEDPRDGMSQDDESAPSPDAESNDSVDGAGEVSETVSVDEESTESQESGGIDHDDDASPSESLSDVEGASGGESTESGDDEETDLTVDELESMVVGLEDQLAELSQQFTEHKQRNERKHDEIKTYSVDSFAQNMLKVRDTLQRAIELGDWDDANESRLNAVIKQFDQQFTKNTIEPVDPDRGTEFDPRYHEAIKEEESDEFDAERVLRVETRGFVLVDRPIRPAKVVISARD